MSEPVMDSNPYLTSLKNEFMELDNKKTEMEKDFKPEMSDEYVKNKQELINKAIELIKITGVYSCENEKVSFVVESTEYEFPLSLFKEKMDEQQYKAIFGKYEKNAEPEDKKSMFEEQPKQDYEQIPNDMPYGFNGMPFYGFYPPQFIPPAMHPQSLNETSSILKELTSISMRLTSIEQGKTEENEQLAKKYETLKRDYDELKNDYDTVVRKKESLSDKFETINEKFAELEIQFSSIEAKYKAIVTESSDKDYTIADLKKNDDLNAETIRELKSRINNYVNDLDASKSQNKRLEQQVNDLKNELKNKKEALANLSNQNKSEIAEQVNKAIEEEKSKLDKERKEFEEERKNLTEKIASLEEALATPSTEDDKDAIEALKNEISKLRVEKDNIQKNADNLASEKKSLERDRTYNIKRFEDLKSKSVELEKLAFIDSHTDVKNLNAYIKEFGDYNLNSMIMAIVSINGLKKINAEWGKAAGDRIILNVANELKEGFKDCNIYRVMGDQFVVIVEDKTLNSVEGQLIDITRKLAFDDISILFGTGIGNSCKSHNEVSVMAEDNLKKKKNMNLTLNEDQINMYNTLHQSVSPMSPNYEESKEDEPEEVDIDEEIMNFINSNN